MKTAVGGRRTRLGHARTDILALWDFERRHGSLPSGKDGQLEQLRDIAEALRVELGVNEKVMPSVDDESIE